MVVRRLLCCIGLSRFVRFDLLIRVMVLFSIFDLLIVWYS